MRPLRDTSYIGKVLHYYDSTDSTNSRMHAMLSDKTSYVQEGTLVLAGTQTAGRGQRQNVWADRQGSSVLATVLFKPQLSDVKKVFYLNKAVAVALQNAIAIYCPDVRIKWPNDILSNGKKIAGILIENGFAGNTLTSVVCGFGINVLQDTFPDELPHATSIYMVSGKRPDLAEVLQTVAQALESTYDLFRAGAYPDIDKMYHEHLFGLHIQRPFLFKNEPVQGVIQGVHVDGSLKLQIENRVHSVNLQDVQYIL